ncbi:MAG: beta-galactosidase [Treponema sp.]|nr:beta-galactosidase [Treponema sp.]
MTYSFDNISILRDGKRWFPTMGEIHYSRVPHQFWAETLNKMKAGGVDIVSTYVIWIHHEEIENEYDWSGDRDLRAFAETAKKCGVKLWLRIGPWCHGEVRNGGFPDWLLHKNFEPRTNNEEYFKEVEKWYRAVYEQVKDFICSPGHAFTADNPIIGIQIENEFGHCGGLYDESGEDHMRRLQQMAQTVGFNVAMYTATGWGGARTGGMLPVMGGYCDAPWDQSTTEIEPSGNYIFTHERNDHNIGSDHGFGYGITFDIKKFPYLTAELGGGLQVTAHRRTIATAQDIAAVATVKLGSGVNLLGYYMYCGGTNPDGKLTTLQESRETGYPNDLPIKSYDFRAPIREFGQVSDTLRELKLISYFTSEFGSELCDLPADISDDNPRDPSDFKNLRYSFRTDGKCGYIFINNYVRHHKMAVHDGLAMLASDGKTRFMSGNLQNGEYFFLPFNMTYGGVKIKTATATPLCSVGDKVVFYRTKEDKATAFFFAFPDDESEAAGKKQFLVLTHADALNAWKAVGNRLLISSSDAYAVINEKNQSVITGRGTNASFCVYPDFDIVPDGWEKTGSVNKNIDAELEPVLFTKYERKTNISAGMLHVVKTGDNTYTLDASPLIKTLSENAKQKNLSDCFVTLNYIGESAKLYGIKDGKRTLLLDHFFLGESYPWEIGLKRFVGQNIDFEHLEMEIIPLKKDADIYLEERPQFDEASIALLRAVKYEYEWSYLL